jgi:signal recognition particle subunit SRP54
MFETLSDKFQVIKRRLLGYGRITRSELDPVLREIRVTLLEADVNYQIVKTFIQDLDRRCRETELAKSLKPGELVIKAVYDGLVDLLGKLPRRIEFRKEGPTIIGLIGLQGAGKTTTAVKLGLYHKTRSPLLVPADIKRPAAAKQLASLAQRAGIASLPLTESDILVVAKKALAAARQGSHGMVVVDTAGRLHIDEPLIQELIGLDRLLKFNYRLLVADGMSGQDAVNQARAFHEKVGLQGAILTKMDGDARGGAALSISQTAQVPIFYLGTSENLDGLEEFYPDRMAQRILGMGDITGLVEKVKGLERQPDQLAIRQKIMKGDLNFEDFLKQLAAFKKLGPLSKVAAMIPGVKEQDVDENELKRIEVIINSMTRRERLNPDIIDGSRKRRIAAGSGTSVTEVNRLLKQFNYMRSLMKKISKGSVKLPSI